MCFSVIIGKKASRSGHVLFAANDDGAGCPGHVHHTPHRWWPDEAEYVTVDGTRIPQPRQTFSYTYSAADYKTGTLGVSWADGINEKRVAVSMTGVYAFSDYHSEKDHLEADDIALLLLERGESARQAILTIGDLIARYGFTVSTIEGAEGTATIAVADPEEGFFLELLPGGHWCARRVRDNMAECRANCFGIGEIDFDDPVNFLHSPGLYEFAVANGKVLPGERLNFAKAFGGDVSSVSPAYGGALNPVNTMRKWCFHQRVSGVDIDPAAPVWECSPLQPVGLRDLMDIMRSDLKGTRFDASVLPEGGLHHNPFWATINPSIAQSGTIICILAELSPDLPESIGCPIWFSYANARLSPFVPCFSGGHGLPKPYQIGKYMEFDPASAWWVYQELSELCYRNYDEIAEKLLIPEIGKLEDRFVAQIEEAEKALGSHAEEHPTAVAMQLSDLTDALAMEALQFAAERIRIIKGKYLCNTVLDGSNPLVSL